jgi:catechol 2,3-dioxygenase-like lactoylglutathione lyase family enzyme
VSIELNHTIIWCRDKQRSADFLTGVLGRPVAHDWGPFKVVDLDNNVSVDFHTVEEDPVAPQHYAFLITEADFDAVHGRLSDQGVDTFANPGCTEPGFNRNDGGRGTYFRDPDGHILEVITRPYGAA